MKTGKGKWGWIWAVVVAAGIVAGVQVQGGLVLAGDAAGDACVVPGLDAGAPAASHEELWYRTWGGLDWDEGYSIAIGSEGDMYLTGSVESFGSGSADIVVIRYNANSTQVWNRTWGGVAWDDGRGIALDDEGNVFVTGGTQSFGAGNNDLVLVKYDENGNQIWNRTWGGAADDSGRGVWVDDKNGVYTVGITRSFGNGNADLVLIKWNASSGNQIWNRTWGGQENDGGWAIIGDQMGDVHITGYTMSFGGGNYDIVLVKYDQAGNQLWNRTWGATGVEMGYGVVLDSMENIVISGYTTSIGAGNRDAVLIKYDSAGNMLWNRTWGGNLNDEARDVVVDVSNNVYITGNTYSFGAGESDVMVVKYNPDGNQLWNHTWGGSSWDEGRGIAIDGTGSIFLTGYTGSFVAALPSILLVKFSPPTLPSAPRNLVAARTGSPVHLSWVPPLDNGGLHVDEYCIYRSTTSGSGHVFLANVSGTSFTDDTAALSNAYYYVVRAVTGAGEGPASTEARAPGIPLVNITTPTPSTSLAVGLEWTAVAEATSYTVYRHDEPITPANLAAATPVNVTTGLAFTGDVPGHGSWWFAVVASTPAGSSPPSNSPRADIAPLPAPVLAIDTASPARQLAVALSWTAVPGATNYTVYRHDEPVTVLTVGEASVVNQTTGISCIDVVPGDGTYHYAVVATNASGNSAPSNSPSIDVDTTPPAITIHAPLDQVYPARTGILLALSFTEPVMLAWYAINGGANVTFTGNTTITVDADGSFVLEVFANDTAGNVGHATRVFQVDTLPPVVAILQPLPLHASATVDITLAVNATDPNLDATWYSVNGSANVTFSGNGTVTLPGEGWWEIAAWANDTAGRTSATASVLVLVDTTAPSITILSPANGSMHATANMSFVIEARDPNLVAIWYVLDGSDPVPFPANASIPLPDGPHVIAFFANDTAGNVNSTGPWHVVIDTIPPTVIITSPANATHAMATLLVEITVLDAGTLDTTWFSWNGTNVTYSGPVNVTFPAGFTTLHAWANDTTGNLGTTEISFTVAFLPPAPVLTITTPSPATGRTVTLSWAAVPGATSYSVFRHVAPVTVETIGEATLVNVTTGTSFTDTVPGTGTYHYAVVATNTSGSSAPSNSPAIEVTGPAGPDWMAVLAANWPFLAAGGAVVIVAIAGTTVARRRKAKVSAAAWTPGDVPGNAANAAPAGPGPTTPPAPVVEAPVTARAVLSCLSCGARFPDLPVGGATPLACPSCGTGLARVVACPGCATTLSLGDGPAGTPAGSTVACPSCHGTFVVEG